jgi:formiminotetrahydrofolate cyclodeaminase
MAAALGAMVATLSERSGYDYQDDRRYLAAAVERDAGAFKGVMAAYRMPKAERAPFVEEALHKAAIVPLEVAERSFRLRRQLDVLRREAPAKFSSDVETACALAGAAVTGALANVRINLSSIKDEAFRGEVEQRMRALQ